MDFDLDPWITLGSSGASVRLTPPPLSFLRVPPSEIPQTLPPPSDHPTLAHPFTIPIDVYNAALSPNVPILAALVYTTTVHLLNGMNEKRSYKPWAFSRTHFFRFMVIIHNITLALYSAWTCMGMINVLTISFYSPWDEHGLAGTVDSLCKIHGPRGPGSAAIFEESTSTWTIANRFFHLGPDGLTPDSTDVGRIWNEGLAFYGWLFYLSKFYEVIDTLIILAKGKKSSFLQTYHHAGAMICMWAGIRYMSPPIWMFVLVNSFIHSIMYTFYLCSAVKIKVPVWFKRSLTTMQITQFVVGASYAFAHLFIKYQSPVSIPYIYHLGNAASALAADASTAASAAASTAAALATNDWQSLLKKAVLRAAGREGLAENVFNHQGQAFGSDATKAAQDWVAREETRYRDELQWTHCLSTSGQTFAILLNVVYLLPLTWLFAKFFVQSYLQRVDRRRSSTASQKAHLARQSVSDAAKMSSRRLSQAFEDSQAGIEDTGDESAIIDEWEVKDGVNSVASEIKTSAINAVSNTKETINRVVSTVQEESSKVYSKAESKIEEAVSTVKDESSEVASKAEEETEPVSTDEKQGMTDTLDDLKQRADLFKAKAEDQYEASVENAQEGFEKLKKSISAATSDRVSDRPADGTHDRTDERVSDAQGDSKPDKSDDMHSKDQDSLPADSSEESAQTRSSLEEDGTTDSGQGPNGVPSSAKSAKSESIPMSQEGPTTNKDNSSTKTNGTDESAENTGEPIRTGPEEERIGTEDQELSPKEQVRESSLGSEDNAEVVTGDAKEDDSPAKQSPSEDVGREDLSSSQKPHEEEHSEQDTSLKGVEGKDVTREKNDSEDIPGERLTETAVTHVQELASNTVDTARNAVHSALPVGRPKEDVAEPDGAPETHDCEDQKESWIHVQPDIAGVEQENQHQAEKSSENIPSAAGEPEVSDSKDHPTEHEKSSESKTKSDEDGGIVDVGVTKEGANEKEGFDTDPAAAQEQDASSSAADSESTKPTYAEVVTSESKEGALDEHNTAAEPTGVHPDNSRPDNAAENSASKFDENDVPAELQPKSDEIVEDDAGGNSVKRAQESEEGHEAEIAPSEDQGVAEVNKKESEPEADPASEGESEWFEKLTTGIDSPTKAKRFKEGRMEDKIIEESEPVRDALVNQEANDTTKAEEGDQASTHEQDSNLTADSKDPADDKTNSESKHEQDKIIEESEPVRDEIKELDESAATAKEDVAKKVEAGA